MFVNLKFWADFSQTAVLWGQAASYTIVQCSPRPKREVKNQTHDDDGWSLLFQFNCTVRSQCCDRGTGNEEICEIAALLSSHWSETILASDWLEHHHDWKIFHALAPLCRGFQVSVLSKFSDVYFNFQRIVTNKNLIR